MVPLLILHGSCCSLRITAAGRLQNYSFADKGSNATTDAARKCGSTSLTVRDGRTVDSELKWAKIGQSWTAGAPGRVGSMTRTRYRSLVEAIS